ncbi:MAG: stage II sporulation protein P [Oscillospiraceae bacterium]
MKQKFAKVNFKKKSNLIFVISFGIILALIYFLAFKTLPLILPCLAPVANFSAKLSFVETGQSLPMIVDNYNEEKTLKAKIDDVQTNAQSQSDMGKYQGNIPISNEDKEKPIKKEAQTQQQTATNRPANSGIIKHQTFIATANAKSIKLANGFIKNCTTVSNDKISQIASQKPKFKIEKNGKPQVLIMHTHTTESFQLNRQDWFLKSFPSRSRDETRNMVAVGNQIENELKQANIGVIHNKTLHDYPSYNGSYERSRKTVKQILKENPSIKIVLDVHRDAIQPNSDMIISPVTKINGKDCAQIMIISGCDNGSMGLPNYLENLKFSSALQQQMEKDYKTLTRPILFDYRKYNQDLTTGSLLLEVGGHANTTQEAIYAGQLAGKSLVKVLNGLN